MGSLLKNTSIYMVGSMLSKLLNIVMLPYISVCLSTAEYGIYDMIQTITSVALPVFTMQMIDAAFRFVYKQDDKRKGQVLTNVWVCVLSGIVLFVMLVWIISKFFYSIEYAYILCLYYAANVFVNMYQRIARCYEHNEAFAISGVIQTFVMLIFQIFFLKFFDMKEDGLVYAYVLSVVIACVYIEFCTKSLRDLRFKQLSRSTILEMVAFSGPLVPNSISWWVVSSINRFFIVSYIGYAANGIYSMSNRFASLVTMAASTFQLAWQEFALGEINNPERNQIFSKVFNVFLILLSFITAIGTLFQQIFFNVFISEEFIESFKYIPIVMISVAISSISSFYGTGYFVFKKTQDAFKTTVLCALLNVVLCYLFAVSSLGLYGIAFAGVISYGVMWLIRHFRMKGYFHIKVDFGAIVVSAVMVIVSVFVYYINSNMLSIGLITVYGIAFILVGGKPVLGYIRKRSDW